MVREQNIFIYMDCAPEQISNSLAEPMQITGSGWMAAINAGSMQSFLILPETKCPCRWCIPALQSFLSHRIIRRRRGQKPFAKGTVSRSRGRQFRSVLVSMKMRTCISTSLKCGVAKINKSYLKLLAQIFPSSQLKTMKPDVLLHLTDVYGSRKSMASQVLPRFPGPHILLPRWSPMKTMKASKLRCA